MVRKLIAAFLATFAVAFPLMTWACGDGVEVMASGSMAGGSMGGGSAPRRPLPAPAPAPSTAKPTKEMPPVLVPKEQPSEEAMTLKLLAHGRQKEIEALKAKLAEMEAKLQQPPAAPPAKDGKDGRDGKDAPAVDLTAVTNVLQLLAQRLEALEKHPPPVVNVPAPVVNVPPAVVNVPAAQPVNIDALTAEVLKKLPPQVAFFEIVPVKK